MRLSELCRQVLRELSPSQERQAEEWANGWNDVTWRDYLESRDSLERDNPDIDFRVLDYLAAWRAEFGCGNKDALTLDNLEMNPRSAQENSPFRMSDLQECRWTMRNPALTILIDTREQNPLDIRAYPTRRETLETGNYGVDGFSSLSNPDFILVRKSISDLCTSLGREREVFFQEVERMRGFRFRGLVIEGKEEIIREEAYSSLISPGSVLSTLDALSVRAGVHVFWCGDTVGAAARVESLARMFARQVVKDFERLPLGNVERNSRARSRNRSVEAERGESKHMDQNDLFSSVGVLCAPP